jgi:hypothetical protein
VLLLFLARCYAYAEYPNPTPMEVYIDREYLETSIQCYVMLSMFQGDLVQQGASAKVKRNQGKAIATDVSSWQPTHSQMVLA